MSLEAPSGASRGFVQRLVPAQEPRCFLASAGTSTVVVPTSRISQVVGRTLSRSSTLSSSRSSAGSSVSATNSTGSTGGLNRVRPASSSTVSGSTSNLKSFAVDRPRCGVSGAALRRNNPRVSVGGSENVSPSFAQPSFGRFVVGAEALDLLPKPGRVVQVPTMGQLVQDHIVADPFGHLHQPPIQ